MVLFVEMLAASAADVEIELSSRESYVGSPIVMQIQIDDASNHTAPEVPEVDGLTIKPVGPPSKSTQISILNGRRSEKSSVTYQYQVTPSREGSFTIPPIKVVVDGLATVTKAVRFVATKSETGDLLFVEIVGKQRQIFVGEPLELSLRIWVRPYRDAEQEVSLSEADMWRLFSDQTEWGKFAESLTEMSKKRQRPAGRRVLREDSAGHEREYLLYEIDATVYPTHAGKIDGDDVRIVVNYPTAIGRRRSVFPSFFDDQDFPFGGSMFGEDLFRGFGSGLAVTGVRPIVAEATVEPIEVEPIPEQGRPADYRGAVGQYSIIADAKPGNVKVGDPITLHIAIDGTGPMDLVLAPPLSLQPDLTADFKVPDEALAGYVDGKRKVFTTTIRPKREGITEIPAISLSYFDPQSKQFVRTQSDPIPIEVEPADMLTLDAIVGGQTGRRPQNESSPSTNEVSPQSVARFELLDDADLLQSHNRPPLIDSEMLAMLLVPPVLVIATLLISKRSWLDQFVSAHRTYQSALAAAETPEAVVKAMDSFLARRLGIIEVRSLRDQIIGRLRASGHIELAIRVERFYANCLKNTFAAKIEVEALKEESSKIADQVNQMPKRSDVLRRARNATAVLLVSTLVIAADSTALARELRLTVNQQQTLLNEAIAGYRSAMSTADPADAKDEFSQAAKKFQMIVDSGVRNDRLFYNLGNAYFQTGDPARAIAAYRHALRLDPGNPLYHHNLRVAEQRVSSNNDSSLAVVRRVNDRILRVVSPRIMNIVFLSTWAGLCGALILRLTRFSFPWKSVTLAFLMVSVVAGGSYFLRITAYLRDDTAVLVASDVVVHKGDGEEFPAAVELENAAGQLIRVLGQRGGWINVRLDNGTEGWVMNQVAETI